MPIPRSLGSTQVTSRPPISTCPRRTSMRPAMEWSRVDFPQPDGPSSTMNSPGSMDRSSDSRMEFPPSTTWRSRMITLEMDAMAATSCSALHRAGGDTPHEPPTGHQVHDQRDQRGEDGRRHVDVVLTLAERRVHDVVQLN